MPGTFRNAALLLLLVLILWTASLNPALAIGMRQDVAESSYIELANNGAEFPPGKFPDFMPVAAIGISDRNGKFEIIGSGILVAPNWVLSAAHVVLSGKRDEDFEAGLEVRFGRAGSAPMLSRQVSGIATPLPPTKLRPLLRSGPRGSESEVVHAEFHDLALIRLDSPVTDIAPAPFDNSAEPLVSRPIYIAGFGDASTGNNTKSRTWTPADLKRAAENVIDREITKNPFNSQTVGGILLFDFDNGTEERNSLNLPSKSWEHLFGTGQSSAQPAGLEGASYPGDSGGPAFAKIGTRWCVVAVSGYGTGFPPDRRRTSIQFGDILAYTRISPHSAWIQQQITPPAPPKPTAIVAPADPTVEVSKVPVPMPSAEATPTLPIFRAPTEKEPDSNER